MNKRYICWDKVRRRCEEIATKIKMNKKIKNIYGIPRGGLVPAVFISHLTNLPLTFSPNKNTTAIVDDCIDNGFTRNKFINFKYYYVLVDKQKEKVSSWLVMPWEIE